MTAWMMVSAEKLQLIQIGGAQHFSGLFKDSQLNPTLDFDWAIIIYANESSFDLNYSIGALVICLQ